jgi:two-component system, cell cycle response regulator DivK
MTHPWPMQKILVIDDDELHCRLLYDVLSAKDYEVLLADRGTRGIDLARQNRPQLILLDIRLPDISGLAHPIRDAGSRGVSTGVC